MAIDKTVKLEIRAAYESNNLSVSKILKLFPDCDISPKTIESWIAKEKWKKNSFANEKEAIASIVDAVLPLEDAKELVKSTLVDDEDGHDVALEDADEYAKLVGRELTYKVLHQHSLQDMMAENLVRSDRFAKSARNIGTVATHHHMLTSTYKTMYGEIKYIDKPSTKKIYTDEELDAMSPQELDNLLDM